jgi:hypothetical protein
VFRVDDDVILLRHRVHDLHHTRVVAAALMVQRLHFVVMTSCTVGAVLTVSTLPLITAIDVRHGGTFRVVAAAMIAHLGRQPREHTNIVPNAAL